MLMKNWQRVTIFAVMLLFSVSLCGCDNPIDRIEDIVKIEDQPVLALPPNSQISLSPPPEKMSVDIYWDATISMQGFTRLEAGNVYRTLPDRLGDVLGSMNDVKFYRFGETITPLEGREYLNFRNPEYYTESITSFGNVLDYVKTENLSVVITDLFEDNADWSNVTQKLREKYFSQNKAIAIIGVKNSFSGEIFDVGLNAATFSYDSGDDPFSFRPFYLFLMGDEPQIRAFLADWNGQDITCECVIFSKYFSAQPEFLLVDNAKRTNLFRNDSLKKLDNRLQEIGIKNLSEPVQLSFEGNFQLDPNSLKLKNDGLKNSVTIFALGDNNVWQEQESKEATVSFDLKEFGESYNYTLNLDFKPNDTLPRGKIGLLQVQIVPSRQSVDLPFWISAWDMDSTNITSEQFDGTKTVNLKRIAVSLKDSLLNVAQPVILELDLVVDGR